MDLILENQYQTSVLLIECKRVLNTSWTFLNPKTQIDLRTHAKGWVSFVGNDGLKCFDWREVSLDPASAESAYCVVPGEDRSKPLLERVAAEVVSATEAFAGEEKRFLGDSISQFRSYFSAIVTTAKLMTCSFSPDQISITDGKISAQEFQEVDFVRFRKQLSTHIPNSITSLQALAHAKEHTVFVIQAEALVKFLGNFEIHENSIKNLARRL